MTKPRLLVIVASTRPGRVGGQVADWFTAHAVAHGGFDVEVADLAQVTLPFLDEPEEPPLRRYTQPHTKVWSATIEAADAFVFVMPEYNTGFSAPLKNALDCLYEEWSYKPVGFVAYGMSSSGLRAVQMIKQVVTALRMMPVNEIVAIPLRQRLDEDGRLQPTESMSRAAMAMLNETQRLAGALAILRA